MSLASTIGDVLQAGIKGAPAIIGAVAQMQAQRAAAKAAAKGGGFDPYMYAMLGQFGVTPTLPPGQVPILSAAQLPPYVSAINGNMALGVTAAPAPTTPAGSWIDALRRNVLEATGRTAVGEAMGMGAVGYGPGGQVLDVPQVFRSGATSVRAVPFFMTTGPDGRVAWYRNAGRPLLWSSDLAACKRVEKVARRAARRGTRRRAQPVRRRRRS